MTLSLDVVEPAEALGVIGPRRWRYWLRRGVLAAVVALFAVELVMGWPSLSSALGQLGAPQPGWLVAAVVAELAAMGTYARMQHILLRSAGLRVPIYRNVGA